jgi:hypothetical protein
MKPIPFFMLALASGPAMADPQLTSWDTRDSGQYARIYQSSADETTRTVSKTWSRGAGVQNTPTYAGVSQISYSTSWVYIRSSGLAGHIMGPWYADAAKSANFPNFPSNTAKIYRIPRTPTIPVSKSLTGLGATGCMVNGVSMFDSRDAFSYVFASSMDATPVNGLTGDGVWNRDGYHNEGVTFDPALAHQAGKNYHYHAQPIGLRYQLGDHVDYNATTNRYTESTAPVTKHSPILAWAADGLPVYGPYGYSSPLDPNSGLRRMVSGFVLRNGNDGTTNLTSTGRLTLPAWATRIQTVTYKNGPAVGTDYLLGHFIEDFDYLGDLGFVQGSAKFDLNEQNVRWCATPEYPAGTYAYFTTLNADGTPAYPYTTGRQYFGSPTGGISTIGETVTKFFDGGPNKVETATQVTADNTSGDVTLTWSAVEGGTYLVEASGDLVTWPDLTPSVTASDDLAAIVETGAKTSHPKRFYRVSRTSLATFDGNGFDYTQGGGGGTTAVAPGGSVARGSTVVVTITLTAPPNLPPLLNMQGQTLLPSTAVLATTISGSSISRPAQATVLATFAIPANAPTGLQNIVVTFPAPPMGGTGASYTVPITIN